MDTGRSTGIQELKCMWGLFSILESCQGHPTHKLVSNGRRVNKRIIDHPKRSFDEECRRIQLKTRKRGENACRSSSSSCCVDNTSSTSAEISLKKLTLAAILEAAVCAQEESKLCEYLETSSDEQLQMRAKAFVDQMFVNRKFVGVSSETKSFSNSLKVLNLNEGLLRKETVKSILDAKFSEARAIKTTTNVRDKIVILKPAPRKNASNAKTTSFSFREMKRKLKHTFGGVSRKEPTVGKSEKLSQECICGGVDIRKPVNSSANSEQKMKIDVKLNRGSDIAHESKKVDLSSVNNGEFDVILEAKRHLSARLRSINSVEGATSKKSPKTLQRVLSSPEHDFRPLSPRRESHYCCSSTPVRLRATESSSQVSNVIRESARLSPLSSSTSCDDRAFQLMEAKACSPITRTEDEQVHNGDICITNDTKSNGESDVAKTDSILHPDLCAKKCDITRTTQINDAIKPQRDEEVATHSTTSGSVSEIEAIASTGDDSPSTPFSIYKLDMANTTKYREEHRSPVSVLEPFFTEDTDSPPSSTLQSGPFAARKQLQPRHLDFEECSFESIPHDPSNSCEEDEYHLMQYVQLIVEASNLNWDQLSEMSYPPEELLDESLFDEVDLPPLDCYYDPKLLFDHINEVLMEIYKWHCCSPHWLPFTMPRIMSMPLAEVVLDEIMTEADFYLLPVTENRTLGQIISKDVEKCRSWLDVRLDTERIAIDISDDVLAESLLDIVLEFTL